MSSQHPRLRPLEPIIEILESAVAETAKVARKKYRESRRKRIGAALAPGPLTPLWNELTRACEQQLTRYGEKARLARILGVSRQRVHLLIVAKSACADAERTLQLMAWLAARRRRADPA